MAGLGFGRLGIYTAGALPTLELQLVTPTTSLTVKSKPPTLGREDAPSLAVAAGRVQQACSSRSPSTIVLSRHFKASKGLNPPVHLSKHVPIPFFFLVVIPCELCCGPQPTTSRRYRNGALCDLRTAPCDERAEGRPPTTDDVPCQGPQVRENHTTTARWPREGVKTARRQCCNCNR